MKIEDFILKKYIDGKSLVFLKNYLTKNNYTENESIDLIFEIHEKNWSSRKSRAFRDLCISILLLSIMLFLNFDDHGMLKIILFIASIPFGKSGIITLLTKDQFKKTDV